MFNLNYKNYIEYLHIYIYVNSWNYLYLKKMSTDMFP